MKTAGRPERAPEDRDLLRRYHENRDVGARERLVARHLPLVRSWPRYANRGESLEDIEQVGAIGLLKAIDRFDGRDVSLDLRDPERRRRDQAPLRRGGRSACRARSRS